MTTSSSYDWEMTRDQIITDALRKVGAIDEEATPTAAQLTIGARTLNGVIKTLAGHAGMPLWAVDNTQFSLTATNNYTIGISQTINVPKPAKIVSARRLDNTLTTRIPMEIISIDEFNRLPKIDVTGLPVMLAYNPDSIFSGNISIFPKPDTYTIANCVISIRYHRMFQDFDSGTDTPDFPPEWNLPLVFHLAYALSPDYGVPKQDKSDLKEMAAMYTEMAQQAGYEDTSMNFQPEYIGPR